AGGGRQPQTKRHDRSSEGPGIRRVRGDVKRSDDVQAERRERGRVQNDRAREFHAAEIPDAQDTGDVDGCEKREGAGRDLAEAEREGTAPDALAIADGRHANRRRRWRAEPRTNAIPAAAR